MTAIAEKWFNGIELGSLGLVTPSASGIHDLAPQEYARVFIPGRDEPNDLPVRRSLVQMKFKCVVVSNASPRTHFDLIQRLGVLRDYLSPALGWCEFRIEDRPFERTFARCQGLPVSFDTLPYQMVLAEFDLVFDRYPYWEDDYASEVNVTSAQQTLVNDGTLETPATYTCTATQALATGLTFAVGGLGFTYTGVMAQNDVLVVSSDLADVTLNGIRDFGHTHPDSSYPKLAVGANVVSKLTSGYDLVIDYRRRRE